MYILLGNLLTEHLLRATNKSHNLGVRAAMARVLPSGAAFAAEGSVAVRLGSAGPVLGSWDARPGWEEWDQFGPGKHSKLCPNTSSLYYLYLKYVVRYASNKQII